jgi:hypothetical protein
VLRQLPAGGRRGATPSWPIGDPTEAEAQVWSELWRTPQAAAWETLGWTRAVARYCRVVVAAEAPGAPAMVLSEVRQMEDRLGLSPLAMRRLEWEVAGDEVEAQRATRQPTTTRRLKPVDAVARAV